MDRFRTMESFVRVVRAGSFTIAANQLGLSRALVSRHVSPISRRGSACGCSTARRARST